MTADDYIAKLLTELQRRFRGAGYGSVNRVLAALDLGESYFRDQRRSSRSIDLKVLLDTLELLEVDANEFLATSLGRIEPVEGFIREGARWRLKESPSVLAMLDCRKEPDAGIALLEAELAALDAARDDDPNKVRKQIAALLPRAASVHIPDLLGIYASSCRALGQHADAHVLLAQALKMGIGNDDVRTIGDLLLRCVSLVIDYGQLERSLSLADRALHYHLLSGDRTGIGKALFQQGMAHGYLENISREIAAFRRALDYLPESCDRHDVRRNRFCALVSLAIAHRKLGKLTEARELAEKAYSVSHGIGKNLIGKLVWLQGSICKQCGDYSEAERFFREALGIFGEISPLSMALLVVEIVKVLLLQGQAVKATETARSMATLLNPLAENEIASAAITELIRCATTGQALSETFLDRLTETLEDSSRKHRRYGRCMK